MNEIYLVLDEYEQRDGYFGYNEAFLDIDDAKEFAEFMRKLTGGDHDVFPIRINKRKLEEIKEEHRNDYIQ